MLRFNNVNRLGRFLFALVVLTAVVVCAQASADPPGAVAQLPRRGVLGASLKEDAGAVVVLAIIPGSPAAGAGLQAGDKLLAIDGAPTPTIAVFLSKLKRLAGQSVDLTVERQGATSHTSVVLAEAPKEQDPSIITNYDAVSVDGTLRRTLITVPRTPSAARSPAVFFVGGIGCYSVDLPLTAKDSYALLAHDLSAHGFVTMRLEKSGVGDSQGPPCPTVDFDAESHSYALALAQLRANPLVDPKRVYIFGHSIGTVIAPRLAAQQPVAGIIVAEAVAKNWFEYELINVQRQLQLGGETPAAIDKAVAGKELCMHRLLIEKQPRATILADDPTCADHMMYPASDSYLQEVAALNLADAWTKLTVPVLVIYGRADFETDEADHARIAAIVNASRPGAATYQVIDDMDHLLTTASSQQASYDAATTGKRLPYNEALSSTVLKWLDQLAKR